MRYSAKQIIDIVACAVTLLLIGIAVPSSFYTVSEQERAVVTRFGVPVATQGPGLHFRIPLIERVNWVPTVSQSFTLGYTEGLDQVVSNVVEESFMITKDFNFVTVDFFVEYRVSSPEKYLFASSQPEMILQNLVQAAVRDSVSEHNVDGILTSEKPEIQTKIFDRVTADLQETDIGIELLNVGFQDAEPPTEEVIVAFKNVENAKQQRDTYINEANKERNEAIPAARAAADAILQEAVGYRQSRINEAVGQTARFDAMYEEYIKNKDITRTRLYLETMEEVLPGIKLIIGSNEEVLPIMDITQPAPTGSPVVNASAGASANN
ncbi:MAG: FtsH protease activity modulator HflK [Clostridiales bacterium]|jgi:membrane protease subunit HflK|nr:FtsH protease activity modulator HflK [Clostridiales bacterium]